MLWLKPKDTGSTLHQTVTKPGLVQIHFHFSAFRKPPFMNMQTEHIYHKSLIICNPSANISDRTLLWFMAVFQVSPCYYLTCLMKVKWTFCLCGLIQQRTTHIPPHRKWKGGIGCCKSDTDKEILLETKGMKYAKQKELILLTLKTIFSTLLWTTENGRFSFPGWDCLSQVQRKKVCRRKDCVGGRWVDGGATNLGCSDEFVWSPAVCLPVTPRIH